MLRFYLTAPRARTWRVQSAALERHHRAGAALLQRGHGQEQRLAHALGLRVRAHHALRRSHAVVAAAVRHAAGGRALVAVTVGAHQLHAQPGVRVPPFGFGYVETNMVRVGAPVQSHGQGRHGKCEGRSDENTKAPQKKKGDLLSRARGKAGGRMTHCFTAAGALSLHAASQCPCWSPPALLASTSSSEPLPVSASLRLAQKEYTFAARRAAGGHAVQRYTQPKPTASYSFANTGTPLITSPVGNMP